MRHGPERGRRVPLLPVPEIHGSRGEHAVLHRGVHLPVGLRCDADGRGLPLQPDLRRRSDPVRARRLHRSGDRPRAGSDGGRRRSALCARGDVSLGEPPAEREGRPRQRWPEAGGGPRFGGPPWAFRLLDVVGGLVFHPASGRRLAALAQPKAPQGHPQRPHGIREPARCPPWPHGPVRRGQDHPARRPGRPPQARRRAGRHPPERGPRRAGRRAPRLRLRAPRGRPAGDGHRVGAPAVPRRAAHAARPHPGGEEGARLAGGAAARAAEGGRQPDRGRVRAGALGGGEAQVEHRRGAPDVPGADVPGRAHHGAGQLQRRQGGGHPGGAEPRSRHERGAQHPSAAPRRAAHAGPRAAAVVDGADGVLRAVRGARGARRGLGLRAAAQGERGGLPAGRRDQGGEGGGRSAGVGVQKIRGVFPGGGRHGHRPREPHGPEPPGGGLLQGGPPMSLGVRAPPFRHRVPHALSEATAQHLAAPHARPAEFRRDGGRRPVPRGHLLRPWQ
mmetsp:Transcript_19354/g.54341  ORF Transcript_19354/g.54341 Transcript_19354/m.54341 type:complete len:503 (+) Transcript_19354:820-2328(+)